MRSPLRVSFLFGGGRWIRTTEGIASRFTVCPLWPLGNSPILIWSWWTDLNPRPADYKELKEPQTPDKQGFSGLFGRLILLNQQVASGASIRSFSVVGRRVGLCIMQVGLFDELSACSNSPVIGIPITETPSNCSDFASL